MLSTSHALSVPKMNTFAVDISTEFALMINDSGPSMVQTISLAARPAVNPEDPSRPLEQQEQRREIERQQPKS